MALAEQVFLNHDRVTCKIQTDSMLNNLPPAFSVSWIDWESGFRGSGLRVGDEIVGVNGVPVTRPEKPEQLQVALPKSVGQYAEHEAWAASGARDEDTVTLTVRRRQLNGVGWQTLDVKGRLRAERTYVNEAGRQLLGPGGPDYLANNGFAGSWQGWYEREIRPAFARVMQGHWPRRGLNTRVELQNLLDRHQARVEFLAAHYPGPFAERLKSDWDAVVDLLRGKEHSLPAMALEYRGDANKRVRQVADLAKRAWEAFLGARAGETIQAFPAVDPIRADPSTVVGKYVVLPPIRHRDWVSQAGHNYLTSGIDRGWYFADTESPAAQRMQLAERRYERLVSPSIRQDYAIVGRILEEPRMLVIRDRGVTGLQVEIVAALVGDSMFVDLTQEQGGVSLFAGEEAQRKPTAALPPRSATPREVMEALVAALKENGQAVWNALFADWRVSVLDNGRVVFYPNDVVSHEDDWVRSRRLVISNVFSVNVIWTGDPRDITTGKEFPGAPGVEEVDEKVEHIGQFDGQYRPFADVTVHRDWRLQRVDGGPWRITSRQGI